MTILGISSKRCNSCRRVLPITSFCKSRWHENGISPRCRDCDKIHRHNSTARLLGRSATLTLDDWLEKVSWFNNRCAYCGSAAYTDLDHLVDFEFGGNSTITNCFPVCHPCNLRKQHIDARMGMLAAPEPFRSKTGRPHPFLIQAINHQEEE